jgi:DNA-binding MarR family transcriptional regulator
MGESEGDGAVALGELGRTTGYLVRRLHNILSARWAEDLSEAPVHITPVQSGLLILISENPGVTQARLLETLDVESATLTKSVARLTERGLISKTRNARDRRAYDLHLTDRGEEVLAAIRTLMKGRDRRIARGIAAADYAVFKRVLAQMISEQSETGVTF